ncbi:NFX1-type zinc finger-containing protein 1, partial [Anguilla anguilla]|uniref:NFX1-type zinc finger-containing protein 1 n=1 Tax=Anguilla anguilla TaxID=7936 RepID=UPI0015A89A79
RGGRGGGRGRDQGGDGEPEVRRLGYRALEDLVGKEPSEVAITLSSSPGLQLLLEEQTMSHGLIQLLCQVLSKAVRSRTDRRIVQHLAGVVKDSGFLRAVLPHYVVGMMTDHGPARRAQYPQHLDNIVSLLSDMLSIFPASSVQVTSMLVALLKPAINGLRASGVDIPDHIEQNLGKIQGLVDHLQEKARDGTLRSDNYTFLTPEQDAPPGEGDFRTMTIYPTPEEIHQDQKPFLRPNITSCSYPSVQVYLDTHFRLLREDFVRPLREGIRELLQSYEEESLGQVPVRRKRFDDIRVYFETRLLVPLCTPTGTAYKVQFDPTPLKFVRWQNSKRLLYGSLVCMSQDNFETFLFATVSDRDPADLQKGQVQLSFCQDSRPALAGVRVSDSFLMVETTAYFEAYRHVLEGLQELEVEDLPFQRYIVECQSDVAHPAYLTTEDTYILESIAAPGFASELQPFSVRDPHAWPPMEHLGLDESQMRALKLALTKEFVIIQGPPGTGKTYVGLKIAQALLTNPHVWQQGEDHLPILVVCYTNHALDQFLEGIHGFLEDGIVRVGGRSNSEVLKRFTLRELTGGPGFRRSLPGHLRRAHYEISTELAQAEQKIVQQASQLECSLRGIMHEQFLERFISEDHWDCLSNQPMWDGFEHYGKKQSMILEWLGLGSSEFQMRDQQPNAENAEVEEEELEQEEEEELVEVEEEAELIQAERMIEEAELNGRGERKKKSKTDMAVRALEGMMLALSLNHTERDPAPSADGWQMQKAQRKKLKLRIRRELAKSTAMSEEEEAALHDVWSLPLRDRWRLYRLWLWRYQTDMRGKALQSEQAYQDAAERLAEIRLRQHLCVLRDARVIGMTTTGAAKYRRALQEIRPRLVIVEEAAEVLEAHTITTLSRACQHLILIGDHQQLRPSATVYELAKNFNLEVSLFERLVTLDFPFVRLNYQHRMRPEIARLLTPHIYSELENHPSVLEYENIKGVATNLFFVEHQYPEEEIQDGRSHQNRHEALFMVALCRYLLCQDYQPSQITILTTYTGQLHCLRKLLPAAQFAGVKVHVVDKYQGEENDIILLSLVRSNREGRVGFLQIANRVCVALSRAKKGLYCVGNLEMLGRVKLWSAILHTLREKGQAGPALALRCQNHPGTRALVSRAEDFRQAPEGGCSLPCEFRLDCGHVCTRACHPYDADHKKFECAKPCGKVLCELGHRCPDLCYQQCDDCRVRVEKVVPGCGHRQMVPCYKDPLDFVCQVPCEKVLRCGHPCDRVCGELCTARCAVPVSRQLRCGHRQEDACHYSRSPAGEPPCRTPCGATLACGHPCRGTCHECHGGLFHRPCGRPCGRPLVCSHPCAEPCTAECPPCRRPCQNRCVHSACRRSCGQPCAPCAEPCAWRCPHHRCGRLCHEPCDRPPCNRRCDKALPCGHPCIGLCGEPCPDRCRVCHHDQVTEIFFGQEDDPLAFFIQLEDCGHIFESTAMDHYMGAAADGGGDGGGDEPAAVRLKECPRCRTPVRRNLRYGAHVNRCLAEIEAVKAKVNGSPAQVERRRRELLELLRGKAHLRRHLPLEHAKLQERLKEPELGLRDLWVLENRAAFLDDLGERMGAAADMSEEDRRRFAERADDLRRWLTHPQTRFSEQQAADLQAEAARLGCLARLNALCKPAGREALTRPEVAALRATLEGTAPFTQDDEREARAALKELAEKLPCGGLGVTEKERVMIVSAIGLPRGHWYKCPNGHIYAIGECGGATERGKCPECSLTIGGANHALETGNQVATEMDGAQHAAWSDAANMLNFDLDRLRL